MELSTDSRYFVLCFDVCVQRNATNEIDTLKIGPSGLNLALATWLASSGHLPSRPPLRMTILLFPRGSRQLCGRCFGHVTQVT